MYRCDPCGRETDSGMIWCIGGVYACRECRDAFVLSRKEKEFDPWRIIGYVGSLRPTEEARRDQREEIDEITKRYFGIDD